MLPVHFIKPDAQRFLDALENGASITPDGDWDTDKVLTLAGACLHLLMRTGPKQFLAALARGEELPDQHPERQEAMAESFNHDLHAGIQLCADLAVEIDTGGYDERFESEVGFAVEAQGERVQARALFGVKGKSTA